MVQQLKTKEPPEQVLLTGNEYNGLLPRFQSIWAKLNDKCPEEAPPLYVVKNALGMQASYHFGSESFIITDKFLDALNDREVDGVLHHEITHQVKNHEYSPEDLFKIDENFHHYEFEADSVATAHGYGDDIISSIEKGEQYNQSQMPNNLSFKDRALQWIVERLPFPEKHPPPEERIAEIRRIQKEQGLSSNEECDTLQVRNADIQQVISQNRNCIEAAGLELRDSIRVGADPCNANMSLLTRRSQSCSAGHQF